MNKCNKNLRFVHRLRIIKGLLRMIKMKKIFFLTLIVLDTIILTYAQGSNGPAEPCIPSQCQLPDCRCSSTDVPGGLDASNVPQVISFVPLFLFFGLTLFRSLDLFLIMDAKIYQMYIYIYNL